MWYFVESSKQTDIVYGSENAKMLSEGGIYTSRSCGYESKEELIKNIGVLDAPCMCCGRIVKTRYEDNTAQRLIAKNMCFWCDFWDEKQDAYNHNPHVIVAEGEWMVAAPEDDPSPFRGFGGREFQFIKDGKIIRSTNVWYAGVIPPHFRDRYPDNAVTIK